jgi:hypothetical protein
MAPGSTQPLTETSTRNLPGGKGRPARKADNLTVLCEPIVWKVWESLNLRTLWAFKVCYRIQLYLFFLYLISSLFSVLSCTHKKLVSSQNISNVTLHRW